MTLENIFIKAMFCRMIANEQIKADMKSQGQTKTIKYLLDFIRNRIIKDQTSKEILKEKFSERYDLELIESLIPMCRLCYGIPPKMQFKDIREALDDKTKHSELLKDPSLQHRMTKYMQLRLDLDVQDPRDPHDDGLLEDFMICIDSMGMLQKVYVTR